MNYAYQFTNLLGTVYKKGNVEFLPKKDTLASPVGNRLTLFNLKENVTDTLPITTKYNIKCMTFSPDGRLAILLDEEGNASLVSLLSRNVIHKFRFQKPVSCIRFNPDGKKFVVAMEKVVLVYHSPGKTREINPFTLYRSYHGAYDDVTTFDWTDDSAVFAAAGKDMNTRIYSTLQDTYLTYNLGGHKDEIIGCFFEDQSLDMYSISKDGALNIWESNIDLKDLSSEDREQIKYNRLCKYYYSNDGKFCEVSCVSFHKKTRILATGFLSGSFSLHELPGFNWIHSLNISEQGISSASFNYTGDWLALASADTGQLLVWEWRSETSVMKQHGHFNNMTSLDYSSNGRFIVTGGEDGKVKVWNTSTGFCYVTFTEHTCGVSKVLVTSNDYVILSASLDGTVRAFDMHRYRNFRTFTSPTPVQFVSLAVDNSGDFVCAGSSDDFGIYFWSMRTGRLLDVLSGHEGPVVALSFSAQGAILASGSWDKTVKLWNVLETKTERETLMINHDVLDIEFKPDGSEIAVSALNAEISIWDVQNGGLRRSISCRHDIVSGRSEHDRVSSKSSSSGKAFDCISYSPDGQSIIAGGKTCNLCIYNSNECLLMKRFIVSQNLSFDASEEFLDRRKMTEFGPAALIDVGEGDETRIKLPGVQKGDMCSRFYNPEVCVKGIKFSPAGREWAAVTTEGLLMYSLDASLVFDPFDLDVQITPDMIHNQLKEHQYSDALVMSLRLNETDLIAKVVETIPANMVESISSGLKPLYVEKLLDFISNHISKSCRLHFYVLWVKFLFIHHATVLKQHERKIAPTLNNILKKVMVKKEKIGTICDSNRYQMQYILSSSKHFLSKQRKMDEVEDT